MLGRKILIYVGLLLTISTLILFLGSCKPKNPPRATTTPPTPPPPPAAPAPTITLEVSPAAIEKGQSATLRWDTASAETVTIEPGIGTVATAGSRAVSPNESTTYRAEARNRDKRAEATARLTVTPSVSPEITPPKTTETDTIIFDREVKDAFFDYDKYDLRSDAREALRRNSETFKKYSHWKFVIEGHCDERGTEEYNMALGDRRASVAKEFLASMGVPTDRMATISYGKSRPFDPRSNEEAWAKNRRAHFQFK